MDADRLSQALGLIVSRFYVASLVAIEKALASTKERAAPEACGRTGVTLTKHALRDGLDYVAGMPAPHEQCLIRIGLRVAKCIGAGPFRRPRE